MPASFTKEKFEHTFFAFQHPEEKNKKKNKSLSFDINHEGEKRKCELI
jgi:hypothetical protein